MHPMIKALAIMAVVISTITPICLDDSDAASAHDGLLLYQINPKECEGVAIHNYSSSTVDMKDYTITDNPSEDGGSEGALTFSSIKVEPGKTLVLASEYSEGNYFCNQSDVLFYKGDRADSRITASSRFNLANGGDDVYLFKNGKIVDAVYYGSAKPDSNYWAGDALMISGSLPYQRYGTVDLESSASEWKRVGSLGLTTSSAPSYTAMVTPFLFPESGGIPVYQALESATESIYIEMYQLMSWNALSLLSQKAASGVEVRLLLEGDSLDGGNYDSIGDCLGFLRSIEENGGEVRLIGGTSYDRFDYVHSKYAVIDGSKVIVTSENWTKNNLNGSLDSDPYDSGTLGNRGWGAVIENNAYSQFMLQVFENDWSMVYGDVRELDSVYKGAAPDFTISYTSPQEAQFKSYEATVTPVLSFDDSYDALKSYVSSAKVRAYSQQQSLGSTYTDVNSGPISLFSAIANDGVDCKLIFNSSISSSEITSINSKTLVKAASMSDPYVHNKGLICDDVAWVSSINWTTTSFDNNREVCVAISSAEVADYFADAFISDFDYYYSYGGISASFTEFPTKWTTGDENTVTVTVSPSGTYTYTWKIDGNGVTNDSPRMPIKADTPGNHTLTVVITSGDQTTTLNRDYVVQDPTDDSNEKTMVGIGAVIVGVILAVLAIIQNAGSKKKKRSRR